jgi:hypothetical protein
MAQTATNSVFVDHNSRQFGRDILSRDQRETYQEMTEIPPESGISSLENTHVPRSMKQLGEVLSKREFPSRRNAQKNRSTHIQEPSNQTETSYFVSPKFARASLKQQHRRIESSGYPVFEPGAMGRPTTQGNFFGPLPIQVSDEPAPKPSEGDVQILPNFVTFQNLMRKDVPEAEKEKIIQDLFQTTKKSGNIRTLAQFRTYLFDFLQLHERCGDNCPHLKKFYDRFHFTTSGLKDKQPLVPRLAHVDKVPKFKQIMVEMSNT